jgi:hypothetical protein
VSVKNGVTRSRPALSAGVARKAIRIVIAKRGSKPTGPLAWFRSLSPERQASLRKRFLGHFGQPATSNIKKSGGEKTKPAPKKAKKLHGIGAP